MSTVKKKTELDCLSTRKKGKEKKHTFHFWERVPLQILWTFWDAYHR